MSSSEFRHNAIVVCTVSVLPHLVATNDYTSMCYGVMSIPIDGRATAACDPGKRSARWYE